MTPIPTNTILGGPQREPFAWLSRTDCEGETDRNWSVMTVDGRCDEALMAAVSAGEQAALAALVERYHAPLLGYLYRLTGGNRPLAEDLVQETFLGLLRRSGYQPHRPFKPWLYAVATNLARDHYRSAAVRHGTMDVDGLSHDVQDTAAGPEERAIVAEEGYAVACAIARLGDEYRTVVLLRFYNGLSLREIAETLGVPLGTIKSRLSVGTRRLRDMLASAQEGVCR